MAMPPLAGEAAPPEAKLIAPVWHTAVIVAVMLGNSYATARFMGNGIPPSFSSHMRILQYGVTIAFEILLLLFVWFGLWLKKFKMRDLIGGKWSTPEDFLLDVAVAVGFWIVAAGVLAGLAYALGMVNAAQAKDMEQRLAGLIPQGGLEAALWISLSVTAGLVEEIVFRGYLQRQAGAICRNIYAGLIVSALIFGASHGYEGAKNMVRIAVFGALFGLLALWRKSLRPGMMAHAWQDALAGIVLMLAKKGLIPMK